MLTLKLWQRLASIRRSALWHRFQEHVQNHPGPKSLSYKQLPNKKRSNIHKIFTILHRNMSTWANMFLFLNFVRVGFWQNTHVILAEQLKVDADQCCGFQRQWDRPLRSDAKYANQIVLSHLVIGTKRMWKIDFTISFGSPFCAYPKQAPPNHWQSSISCSEHALWT